MANVLGELFQKIADAIREQTGETGTMKPADFPGAILGIEAGSDITLIDNIDITPDFSHGNQFIVAQEGYAVKGATILKPETLIPENVAKGVEIAGVVGTMGGGGGSSADVRVKYVTFMNGATELIKYPVIVGDTCHDPVTNNSIPAPTKESTAQYTYEHNGWSLTDGGDASVSALTNVTEDRTVYAAFKATVREYTITYLDSDGVTVLKTEQLPYGTVPSYVPTSSSGIFKEWIPAPTAVTGNASYKAVWSAAIVVIPQTTITVRTDGTSGVGTAGSATEDFVWGAKYRLTVDGETSEWVATQYYTTFADGNKFMTSGIGNPWARTNRNGSAVTAHRLNSHTGPTVSDTGEKFFVGISGPSTTGEYTASLYAKKAGTYTISVVRIPD